MKTFVARHARKHFVLLHKEHGYLARTVGPLALFVQKPDRAQPFERPLDAVDAGIVLWGQEQLAEAWTIVPIYEETRNGRRPA